MAKTNTKNKITEAHDKATIEANVNRSEEEVLKLRLKMLRAVRAIIDQRNWCQSVAAKNLGVTQPRISNIYSEKVDKFSVEFLTKLLIALGHSFDFSHKIDGDKVKLSSSVK